MSFDSSVWLPIQDTLSETCRVFSYDRAGLGASIPLKSSSIRNSKAIVDDLECILEILGPTFPPPYVIVGHSLGGIHAMVLLHRIPSTVVGLVLLESTGKFVERYWEDLGSGLSWSLMQALVDIALSGNIENPPILKTSVETFWNAGESCNLLVELDRQVPGVLRKLPMTFVRGRLNKGLFDFAKNYLVGSNVEQFRELLDLILLESFDKLIDFDVIKGHMDQSQMEIEELMSLSDFSKVFYAENSGHFVVEEEPEVVIDSIL
ncbi:hypothetical protein HK096_008485, partial [Nowakowskiella sp. JEL0078]